MILNFNPSLKDLVMGDIFFLGQNSVTPVSLISFSLFATAGATSGDYCQGQALLREAAEHP